MLPFLAFTTLCNGPITVQPNSSTTTTVTCASPTPLPRPSTSPSAPPTAPTAVPWNYLGFVSGVHPGNVDTNCGLHIIPPYGCLPVKFTTSTGLAPAVGLFFRAAVNLIDAPALHATAIEFAKRPFPGSPLPPVPPTASPTPVAIPTPNTTAGGPWDVANGISPPAGWQMPGFVSPFNRKLPANPHIADYSAGAIASIKATWPQVESIVSGVGNGDLDYNMPIYFSNASDPLYTISCHDFGGGCGASGKQVRIPNGARKEVGADGHLSVLDQTIGRYCDFWQAPDTPSGNGGDYSIAWGNCKDANSGDNVLVGMQGNHGGMASQTSILKPQDLLANRIGNGLQLFINCLDDPTVPPGVDPTDQGCTNGATNQNMGRGPWPHYGDWLRLNMSPDEINATGWSQHEKTVAIALATYGGFFADTGNGGGIGFQAQAKESWTSFGAPNPWIDVAARDGIQASGGRFYFDFSDIPVDRMQILAPCEYAQNC